MFPLLDIKGLSVDFVSGRERTHAVKNISFFLNRGEVLAIVGESGSGKSVTALSVLGLLPSPPAEYTAGQILLSVNGHEPSDLLRTNSSEMRKIRGNQVAMIFQEPMSSLNPVFTCGHQVQEAIMQHKKIKRRQATEQVLQWFEKVRLPDPRRIAGSYPHQLSGGQKQRVMIAMAMCCEPSLLICDEPTTALDVTVQKSILSLLKELQQQLNMGVIFITHDLAVVSEIADRAVVMYKGEIVETAATSSIFTRPAHPYTKGLLSCRPGLHPRGERLPVVSDFLQPAAAPLQNSEAGKRVQVPGREEMQYERKTLMEVDKLSVWFPVKKNFFGKTQAVVKAVDEVSFEIYEGETLGLVGESGCGKTTLGRTLLRLIEPTSGKILYKGTNLVSMPGENLRALRKEMQIVFQDPFASLNPRLTIGEAMAEPLSVHRLAQRKDDRIRKAKEMLEKVNLEPAFYNRYPHEFSGGQRQRIVIARALILDPGFIVCDESVSALDVSVQAQILNLLNDLKKELGFTIVFISHDLSVVRYLSDRIMVMNKGRIEEKGNSDQVYDHPKSEYTKKLIDSIPGIRHHLA